MEFFRFVTLSLAVRNFLGKIKFTPQPWESSTTPHGTCRAKNQDLFITLGKAIFFIYLIDLWNFHIINITPRSFKSSTLSLVWNFFWNSSNCHATKIVIWLFGWNSLVYWAIPEKIKTGGVVDILFLEPLLKLLIFHFTFRNLRQREFAENKLTRGESGKLCTTPWKFQDQKPRHKEISR